MDSCAKLKKLIQTANELLTKRVTADLPEFKTWHASALRFLTNEFGEDSIEVTNFKRHAFSVRYLMMNSNEFGVLKD